MSHGARLNRVIELLENGKTVLGARVNSGMTDDLTFVSDAGYDCVIVENEHEGMDFPMLRSSLQSLLDRKRILKSGNLQANPTPIVRIAPNAHEVKLNQWVIKQTLDQGAYGIVVPRLETADEAVAVIAACRYAQRQGSQDALPKGERGWNPGVPARYWGLNAEEYYDSADLWPLDPDGELLLVAIVETALGVANIEQILGTVKGIGIVWAGRGDMSISMGVGPVYDADVVEAGTERILEACKRFNVPCATGIPGSTRELDQLIERGFRVFFSSSPHQRVPPLAGLHAR